MRRLSCGWLAIVADLDDVGIVTAEPGVDGIEVVRRLAEVVEADDPLGLAESRNLPRDIFIQVDVLDALGDGRAEQQDPLLFAADELAAVGAAAAGDNHRTGPVGHQPPQVYVAVDVVQAELDQFRSLVD